jgi:hypothetical protein
MCPEWAAAMESIARPRASLAAVARAAFLSVSMAVLIFNILYQKRRVASISVSNHPVQRLVNSNGGSETVTRDRDENKIESKQHEGGKA